VPSPRSRYRILYVGDNYALLAALQDQLARLDSLVVRVPANGVPEACAFIRSDIPYSAFLFDEVLTGATGEELARFALAQRADTPVLIVKESDGVKDLANRVGRLLGGLSGRQPPPI
jgi:CheY-like chemotaxis protein